VWVCMQENNVSGWALETEVAWRETRRRLHMAGTVHGSRKSRTPWRVTQRRFWPAGVAPRHGKLGAAGCVARRRQLTGVHGTGTPGFEDW
jgi:hypothetical protein